MRHLYIGTKQITLDEEGQEVQPLMPQEGFAAIVRDFLRGSTNLQTIQIVGLSYHKSIDFDNAILEHLAPESRRSLKSLTLMEQGFAASLEHLKRLSNFEYCSLESLTIHEQWYGVPGKVARFLAIRPAALRLESVKNLTIHFANRLIEPDNDPRESGEFFAKAMPYVKNLRLTNTACIYGMLSAYANIGSNLTILKLFSYSSRVLKEYHICPIVSKLAPNLTELETIGVLCHEVLPVLEWPRLTQLKLAFWRTCTDHKPHVIRHKLKHITLAHSQASIFVGRHSGPPILLGLFKDKWDKLDTLLCETWWTGRRGGLQ